MTIDFGPIQIRQFVKERDDALLSMDEAKITAYMIKWGSPVPRPEIFWTVVHKARTGATKLPMFERAASKRWLNMHGSQSMDDGDVKPPTAGDDLKKYHARCLEFGC